MQLTCCLLEGLQPEIKYGYPTISLSEMRRQLEVLNLSLKFHTSKHPLCLRPQQ